MKKIRLGTLVLCLLAVNGFSASSASRAHAKKTERLTRAYRVQKGDTLSSVSERLLGDARGWQALWKENRKWISNPHHLREGITLYFTPGDLTHLPGLQTVELRVDHPKKPPGFSHLPAPSLSALRRQSPTLEDVLSLSAAGPTRSTISTKTAETAADESPSKSSSYPWTDELSPGRSQEWRDLPLQHWEEIIIAKPRPENIDPLGFDRNSRIRFHEPKGVDPAYLAASSEILSAGKIESSPALGKNLIVGEIIQISSDSELNLGETYSIAHEAQRLRGTYADNYGYAYPIGGRVKVIGNGERGYLGVVQVAIDAIERGDHLIAEVKKIPELSPIPGPSAMEARLLLDPRLKSQTVAQHQYAFIDRGEADGISPGMIFRKYNDIDPQSERKMDHSDYAVLADLMVMQTSANYSLVRIVASTDTLENEERLQLLTDVSQFKYAGGAYESSAPHEATQNTQETQDDLDQLDDGNEINPDEAKELQQLENTNPDDSIPPEFEAPTSSPSAPAASESAPEFDAPSPEDLPPPP